MVKDLEERFWSKVDVKGADDCWLWTGYCGYWGYGRLPFRWEGRIASRYSYYINIDEDFNRELFVCHSCDVPACVNPAHLWLGTTKDNMQDMASKGRGNSQKKTHCPQGHEYTPENTYIRLGKTKTCNTKRVCLICKRKQDLVNQMKYYWKKKELVNA